MTGAPKPNSNTIQREERVPLQKTQLHQHVTLIFLIRVCWHPESEDMQSIDCLVEGRGGKLG